MEKQVKTDEETRCFRPSAPLFNQYSKCYHEFTSRFYDSFKHDLKNYHNAIIMSLDLYKLTNEEKYLDKISEASYKSLEHIDSLKEIEPHIFSGGEICFYSCKAAIRKALSARPSVDYEITGSDCYVFADSSFPSLFELLFVNMMRAEKSVEKTGEKADEKTVENVEKVIEKMLFNISLFEEDDFPKCRIDIIFPDFSIPDGLADWILNNDDQRMTKDPGQMAFFAARKIACRYSGDLSLTEHTDDRTVFTLTLYQESDGLKNPAYPVL
ncbi:MAG: hypothetical protein FWE54_04910 [Methanimicrococcus sp.]|nr:hypothetical protein [Methanimicrococcus sp.]